MKIFLIICLVIYFIFFILKKFFSSAQSNLFKDKVAWSNKEIIIKHNKSKVISESNKDDNYLQKIAEESKLFLEDEFR